MFPVPLAALLTAQSVPPTVAQPPRMPLVLAVLVVMLPSAAEMKFTVVPPPARLICPSAKVLAALALPLILIEMVELPLLSEVPPNVCNVAAAPGLILDRQRAAGQHQRRRGIDQIRRHGHVAEVQQQRAGGDRGRAGIGVGRGPVERQRSRCAAAAAADTVSPLVLPPLITPP